MFVLRDATSCKLVTGNNWGDDWLKLPSEAELREIVLSLIEESGWAYELRDALPSHLKGQED